VAAGPERTKRRGIATGTRAALLVHMPGPSPSQLIVGTPTGIATAHAAVLMGLEAHPIRVEVCCTRGPGCFQMVGLAEAAVREARVRVSGSLSRLGVLLDSYAVTVNLAPADLRKSGAALDIAIAVAVLAAVGVLEPASLAELMLMGELALDGSLRAVPGVLPRLEGAQRAGFRCAIVPRANAAEAGFARGLEVLVADSLEQVLQHLSQKRRLGAAPRTEFVPRPCHTAGDLAEVRGQAMARRALEVAAAGGHNLLFVGPPGSGKTLLARLLPTILPPLELEEALECTAIHSVAGVLPGEVGVVAERPFRAPHHSVSEAGLVGGGDVPRPGEISLAHNGVLFLDELAEFRRSALEALRQPLEDGTVCIARARARAWFPARPMLVAAVNPCPCGHFGHARLPCRCSEAVRLRYQARLSGPLLDRIDLHVRVPPVEVAALVAGRGGESSQQVRARVLRARSIQRARAKSLGLRSPLNATLAARDLERVLVLDAHSRQLIDDCVQTYGLSARAFGKVLRVARTIADLEGKEQVGALHLTEAMQGRVLERDAARVSGRDSS
jgi:magnesium chelatase family protein